MEEQTIEQQIINFYESPNGKIKPGMEHYFEKMDLFFSKYKDPITAGEFMELFKQAEKKYSDGLSPMILFTLNRAYDFDNRFLNALNRYTY